MKTVILAGMLLTATLVFAVVPSASAHTCSNSAGNLVGNDCGECYNGSDHSHTTTIGSVPVDSCKSSKPVQFIELSLLA